MTFRILITGSREWVDRELMRSTLSAIKNSRNEYNFPIVVVHGGARGADSMAGSLARATPGATEEIHPVEWLPAGIYNPYAGHARNQKMVDLGGDICVAFFQVGAANRGTADCVKRAKLAGIPLLEIWSKE